MPDRVLTKQAIAKDQLEVASKLDELIAQNFIDADKIISVDVTRFGANQFLILAIYYGSYTLLAVAGLTSDVDSLLVIQRANDSPVGLVLSNARLFEILRSLSASAGLNPDVAREQGISRGEAVSTGLTCNVTSQGWEGEVASLGAVATVEIELALERSEAPTLGLVADESVQHTSP